MLAQRTQCEFAVKGGGHGAFEGASNIANGVTLSMEHWNEITLSSDSSTVRIGPGNTWMDVYEVLEEHDLTVPGGRYPTVGVSGLSLGGGESFFSSLQGWTCDNIERGWDRTFRYMNYAGEFQYVIANYGNENKARLGEIGKKYDPHGVFQTLQPGYFKLDRAAIDEEDYLRG